MKIQDITSQIRPVDREWIEKAKERTAQLVMPPRALGRLHDISEQLCGIFGTLEPSTGRIGFLVMAGDHGVAAEEGVSAFPQAVTGEMVKTFLRGGAGINVLSRQIGAEVRVVDMGIVPDLDPGDLEGGDKFLVHKIARGTANLSRGPAMSLEQAEEAVVTGFQLASELFQDGMDMLGTGEMGIGNTTPATAIGAVFTGKSVNEITGRGAGVDDSGLDRKMEAIARGIEINKPDPANGLDVLSKVGGFEIGGIAGSILAAAYHRRPVVVDGLISTSGALIAAAVCPDAKDYMIAGHRSEEPGHQAMLEHLGLKPVLDLGMRLGEGTGAALAVNVIRGAVSIFREMMTFEEAAVSGKES